MDDKFYDLCYEAWCSGRNPDRVDPDRYDGYLTEGYDPDEISLNMMLPRRRNELTEEEAQSDE